MDTEKIIGRKRPPAFENIKFETRLPCRIKTKNIKVNTVSALHYATTLEILLLDGLDGIVTVGANQYFLNPNGRHVFIIPPNTVHSTSYRVREGIEHVFKISFDILSNYINTDEIFSAAGLSLENIPYDFSDMYDEFYELLVERIRYEENSTIAALEGIMELYSLIERGVNHREKKEVCAKTDPRIFDVLQWTKEHLTENIGIDDVAQRFHYSKYYFCRFFKKHTGKTYNEYLNTLRINYAVELMKQGKSATYCCMECGFDDLSYFIKLFKRVTGYTTNEFRSNLLKLNNERE